MVWKKLRRAQVLTFWASARLYECDYLFSFDFILFNNFNLHLVGGKANLLLVAVICKRIEPDIN